MLAYILARVSRDTAITNWQTYVANCLQILTKNSARFAGGDYVEDSWYAMTHPHVETQSAEDIVADVVARGGLTLL